jgi:murein DD-endopeptidase MepM/ murein hydrolase activator NlpD
MDKGKLKKEKKYLSLILLPHFNDRARTFKINAPYAAIITLSAAALAALLCILTLSIYSASRNFSLQSEISTISTQSETQKKLLDEKDSQLAELKEKEQNTNKDIEYYTKKYKEIIDNYISKQSSSAKTNRSGDPSPSAFTNDIKQLKKLLDNINKIRNVDDGSMKVLLATENKIEKYNELVEAETRLKNYMETLPTQWPTSGRISSRFGTRSDPFHSNSRFHEGLDIAADYGRSIVAAASGIVTFAGRDQGYGNTVRVRHDNGITTSYSHASKLLVKKGQRIKKGSIIARVGSTGRSTGPHLHYEVHLNGTPVNPMKYLD